MEHLPSNALRRFLRGCRAPAAASVVLTVMLVPALVAGAAVNDTSVVSVATNGAEADGASGPGVVVGSDGRYVVFESNADNLSDADNDSVVNIYARDRQTGETQLVSRADGPTGAGGDADSLNPAMPPGAGNLVAFESRATNLSDLDADANSDVFVRDLDAGTTTLISRGADGSAADGDSGDPSISDNGAVVAFESRATNLSDFDHDAYMDVFMYARDANTTRLISQAASGAPADGPSYDPSVSGNGRRLAFASDADNLFLDDRDIYTNVYVALVEPAFTFLTHASRTSAPETHPANGNSTQPALSADGSRVAFTSTATNLAGGVALQQVFVRDLSANESKLVSRADGATGEMASAPASSPSISKDGRLVAFSSAATNLGEAGVLENSLRQPSIAGVDVFVRDTSWDDTVLVSRASGEAGLPMDRDSTSPALAPAGGLLAFLSDVKVGEFTTDPPDSVTVDVLRPTVYAREMAWPEPRPVELPPDVPGHGHGGDGHGSDGHAAGGHGGAGHAADGHGHGAGGTHYLLKRGGSSADFLVGTPLHDKLCGGGGNDKIYLGGGPDVGYGGDCGAVEPPTVTKSGWWRTLLATWRHAGGLDAAPKTGPGKNDNDRMVGGKGDDVLFGGPGSDKLVGGSGADYLVGGSGHDRIVGGPGRNRIDGGGGSDSINSANGVREMVDCGFGSDGVTADRRDILTGCERVTRVRRSAKKDPFELLPECPGGGHECHKDGTTEVLRRARHG